MLIRLSVNYQFCEWISSTHAKWILYSLYILYWVDQHMRKPYCEKKILSHVESSSWVVEGLTCHHKIVVFLSRIVNYSLQKLGLSMNNWVCKFRIPQSIEKNNKRIKYLRLTAVARCEAYTSAVVCALEWIVAVSHHFIDQMWSDHISSFLFSRFCIII